MKQGNLPKKIFKKKTYGIIAIGVFLVAGAAVFAVSVRAKGTQKNAAEASVQSITATKGSISNTIDASGNLEAAETIDITVPAGIKVEKIRVESGEEVTKGQTLAKLNKTSVTRLLVDVKDSLEAVEDELDKSGLSSLEKEELEGERAELKKTEKKLTALYKNPVITASTDGIIGTIYISENAETSNTASSTGSGSDGQGSSLAQLTSQAAENLLFLTADTGSDSSDSVRTVNSSDSEESLNTVTDYSELSIQAPVTGETPQKNITETSSYTGAISWDCSDSTFQSKTVYTATILLTAKSGYTFSEKNLPIIKEASFNWSISHSGEGNTLKIVATYEKTSDPQDEQNGSEDSSNSGSSDSTDNNSGNLGDSGTDNSDGSDHTNSTAGATSGNGGGAKTGSAAGGISGSTARNTSGSAAGSTSGSSTSDTSSASSGYSDYEAVAFAIAKQDSAKIVVNVDELDILSVEKDQSATVTLDALENEEYTGTVTKISNTASAGSGSTKYEVEITVPMDENMRIGMSASAAIQVSSAEDTLLLPMTALQQRGDETFVYTEKDKDGNLSGEVMIETGLSDGQNVEILSGLSEGTEVYYTRAVSSDESDTGGMFPGGMDGMGGMNGMGGNGGMPGNPPDGGRDRSDSDSSRGNGGKNGDGKPSGN